MDAIYILPQDIRHRGHIHCEEGIKKFCQRTGLDYDKLMHGGISADELRSFDTAMGNEAARNAEERALNAAQAQPEQQDKEVSA